MISAIVLAAGESRRMGSQKLLLPFGGKTVISRVVDAVIDSGVDTVTVVTGRESEKVAHELAERPVTFVNNPDYRSGMLSSVRCGLRSLPQGCKGIMVVLGDQPGVTGRLIDSLIQAFEGRGKNIVVPVFQGKRGHPLMFSIKFCDDILTRYDDVGLRGLLHDHPRKVFELVSPDASVLCDIDYPDDYERELAKLDP